MKEHTENVHGKGVPIKEKTIAGQSFMSSFFKRKNDDKDIDEGESSSKVPTFNEAMLDKDRLWLDMCQLMMWQEQIKRWVCLWETRSSKLEAVTDSLCL